MNKIYITDRVLKYNWKSVLTLPHGTIVTTRLKDVSDGSETDFYLMRTDDVDAPLLNLGDGLVWEEDDIPVDFTIVTDPITIDPPKK